MTDTATYKIEPLKQVYRVEEAAETLRLGRTKLYDLLAREEIRSYKEGGVRLITGRALHDYLERRDAVTIGAN